MRFLTILSLTVILFACRNKDEKVEEDLDDVPLAFSDTLLVWDINADSMIIKKDPTIPDTAISIDRIVNGLNEKYPEVKLVYIKQSNDTVYTKVPNGEYLGNQMGTAGASAWFADAVINLTSVPRINYVSFTMDTFSHAGSTVIGREQYKNWKQQ